MNWILPDRVSLPSSNRNSTRHINTCMIITPNTFQYTTAIATRIQSIAGQICLSIALPSTSTWNAIEEVNTLLRRISSRYRFINRRQNISGFLIILSSKLDRSCVCTVLISHEGSKILDKTVTERIAMIQGLVSELDKESLVFKPYLGYELDIQRYHMTDISGAYSISLDQINFDEYLKWSDLHPKPPALTNYSFFISMPCKLK